ncbi:hypothetical protein [Alicyclobacillus vulcanalis]|uniref:Uncharacterized protein n=1 Tax=Alicyclobacillus vulcanalis TaxID=252246 RepID=A0A1N7MRZ2_9BACL|nr:hypothetical protein [Alicyclobacillus vulcanalis]SIS88609.1 hypothetical protein SAMN05421799_10648 [Alicyclobacillus vulcanalis]
MGDEDDFAIYDWRPLKVRKGLPTVIEMTLVVGDEVRVLEYVLRHPDQWQPKRKKATTNNA